MGREREEHPSSLAAEVHADIVWLQALRKLGKARLRTWGSNADELTDWVILPPLRLICKCSSGSPRNWQTRKLLPMAALSAASWDSVLRIDATEVSSPQQRAGCLDLPIKRRVRLDFALVRADCDMRFSHLLTLNNDAEISRW